MKKFMFSAVALVAFSFAGMANEVEMDIETIKKSGLSQSSNDCFNYC
jgi:hypothetical protein